MTAKKVLSLADYRSKLDSDALVKRSDVLSQDLSQWVFSSLVQTKLHDLLDKVGILPLYHVVI